MAHQPCHVWRVGCIPFFEGRLDERFLFLGFREANHFRSDSRPSPDCRPANKLVTDGSSSRSGNGVQARPQNVKMIAFLRRAMPKVRKPDQGHDYGPTIVQIDGQSFLAYLSRLSARLLYVNGQRTHTRSGTYLKNSRYSIAILSHTKVRRLRKIT